MIETLSDEFDFRHTLKFLLCLQVLLSYSNEGEQVAPYGLQTNDGNRSICGTTPRTTFWCTVRTH